MLPPMAEFPTNPTRLDPYKNFKFRVLKRYFRLIYRQKPQGKDYQSVNILNL
jgi:hypothetical protein